MWPLLVVAQDDFSTIVRTTATVIRRNVAFVVPAMICGLSRKLLLLLLREFMECRPFLLLRIDDAHNELLFAGLVVKKNYLMC
jgi:hypothetical protein